MRKGIIFIGLELYALTLALLQWQAGVHTDEAKYLLNIPYPHPPFARFIFSVLDGWDGQELFWRIVLASLVVQAAWLVYSLAKRSGHATAIASAIVWLLSSAVIFQAGTVMMSVLTALQALVFLWLLSRKDNTPHAYLIGVFWLASLFTAYQAVLFAPLVLAVIVKLQLHPYQRVRLFCYPIVLLALYTLTNPLAAASMINHAEKDASQTLLMHVIETGWVWALGGSIALSVTGTLGLLLKPKWGILLSFLLICAYVLLSRYDYYAILFTPFFIAGTINLLPKFERLAAWVLIAFVAAGTVFLWYVRGPSLDPSPVPAVMQAIHARAQSGDVLISGYFGHQWQHASRYPVRRFHLNFLNDAQAVVCTQPCPDMKQQTNWVQADGLPIEVWIKE